MVLFAEKVGYNENMPQNTAKKSEQILINVIPATFESIFAIAAAEDRPIGYVARELMLRGLALYGIDGKVREDATAQPARKAPVVATIGSPKAEIRRNFEKEIMVPVHSDGVIGKRKQAAKRRTK